MSKFPIELSDDEGQVDAINYLLSGPSGLGQNFQGVAAYKPTYLTGFFRKPFTVTDGTTEPDNWTTNWPPRWWFPPINITNAYPIDVDPDTNKTFFFKVEFTPQSTPPFTAGMAAYIQEVIDSDDSSFYDGYYNVPGVVYCDTSSVIIRTRLAYEYPAYVSGGIINTDQTGIFESTDCNARVYVTGGSDTVFITSQNEFTIDYECFFNTTLTLQYVVNRYYGFLDTTDPDNPDYRFVLDDRDGRDPIVSKQIQEWTLTPGTGTVNTEKLIFTTLLDQNIPLGFYWYIAEIRIDSADYGDAFPIDIKTGLRSLTAQVIKQ